MHGKWHYGRPSRQWRVPYSKALGFAVLLASFNPTGATAGEWTRRYQLTLARILSGGPPRYDQQLLVADVIPERIRRFTNFSGDVSGRYIGALACAARASGERPALLDQIVNTVLRHQRPDGHFGGPYSPEFLEDNDMAMLWGNGRLLSGLLEYYDLTGRKDVLETAIRLGEFLVQVAPKLHSPQVMLNFQQGKFAVGYICWTQNIEGLANLYRVTKARRYLELAQEIAARTERYPGQHSHGFLTSLRGILELYRATGERRYLELVEREVQGILDTGNWLVHGAIPEAFRPELLRDEGCSEGDWLRLMLGLWQETGKESYLELAERTLFNEFAFNQFQTGDFGHRAFAPLAPGRPVPEKFLPTGYSSYGARAWWCCTLHGLRTLCDVWAAVFRLDGDTLYYDLPVDGRWHDATRAAQAESSLGQDGTIRIRIRSRQPEPWNLALRQPGWSSQVEVRVNGQRQEPTLHNHYLIVRRRWGESDQVELRYQLRTYIVNVPEPGPASGVSLFHGPWILGVDEETSPYFYDEPYTQNRIRLPGMTPTGEVSLSQATARPEHGFAIPLAHFELEYLPGGYPIQPQRALLRPIAEQTGMRPVAWTFVFFRTPEAQ